MRAIKLEYNDNQIHTVYTIDSTNQHWQELLQFYINFLRGIGYHIPDEEDRV